MSDASQAARQDRRQPFSVLLLYPDDVNDGGHETYYAWVQAPDSIAAVAEAQREALAHNEWTDRDPADFVPLLVTKGHHYGQPLDASPADLVEREPADQQHDQRHRQGRGIGM